MHKHRLRVTAIHGKGDLAQLKHVGSAGILRTAARFGPAMLRMGLMARQLTAPFAETVDRVVTDPWLRRFLDLECFVLRYALH